MGNKNERQNAEKIPTLGTLREKSAAGAASDARKTVVSIFDEGTFVETGALIARRFGELPGEGETELAGVVTGYGAVEREAGNDRAGDIALAVRRLREG